ncbi:MAG: transcriptional regulator [Shinella sp.]|nr:MAG: transcriptional regulator [Shinella sp.]
MADLKSIPLTSILVGDRARPVDADHAAAIAASMVDRGLINPITVRPTPAAGGGKTPYTLIAGGHRLEAARLNGWEDIDAIVVSSDAVEAQLMEIAENLYRNELSAIDRAAFVLKYREIYEEKHGKVQVGGDRKSKSNDWTLIFAPGRELSDRVRDRLGIGRSTYFNVLKIGQNLRPELRKALRGTPYADDQSALLKLAKRPPEEQVKVAAALEHEPDLKKVLAFGKPPKPVLSKHDAAIARLRTAWHSADTQARAAFLAEIGIDPLDAPEALEAAE